jgi:tetratricopeptide (TPR) repeat protein
MHLGAYHPDTIHTLDNLALAHVAAGAPDKALPLFQQAARGLEKLEFTHAEAGRIVGDLCDCLERLKQSDRADLWRREWLAAARAKFGPESDAYAEALQDQGGDLLRRGRYADSEPTLRECLAIRRRTKPEAWTTYYAQSLLGGALTGQARYAEAEPVLEQAYAGLKARVGQIPPLLARHRVAEAGKGVVALYEAWGKTEKAAAWKARLGLADLPADVFARP